MICSRIIVAMNRCQVVNSVTLPRDAFAIRFQEEVTNFLKASKCDLEKVFLNAEVYPQNGAGYHIYDSYYTVSFTRSMFGKNNIVRIIHRRLNCPGVYDEKLMRVVHTAYKRLF